MKVFLLSNDGQSKARFANYPDVEFVENPDAIDETYDFVVLDNVVQNFQRSKALQIVGTYANVLNDGGQFVLIVPSLEWACREIAKNDDPTPAAYIAMYGTDENPNLCGMTLMWMRYLLEAVGLVVVMAKQEEITMTIKLDDVEQSFPCRQNVVIAMKSVGDASEALFYASNPVYDYAGSVQHL